MVNGAPSIRQQLGFTARGWLMSAAFGWLGFVGTVLMPSLPWPVMVVSFVLTNVALLVLIFGLRCPRCRARLSQVGLVAALMPARAGAQPLCHGCKVNLDSPA